MKHFLPAILLLISGVCYSQKYALLDKNMAQPVTYSNTVTLENSYKNIFPVEKDKIHQFILELQKIAGMLTDKKKSIPETFDFTVGNTRFVGLKIPLASEERLDVVLTSECNGIKINMHLSDAKTFNANNAFFINTWIKYIKSYVK